MFVAAPGVVAGWHRRDADEVEFTAVEHQIIVLLAPIQNKESRGLESLGAMAWAQGDGAVRPLAE
jgi:hypothetical protein